MTSILLALGPSRCTPTTPSGRHKGPATRRLAPTDHPALP